MPLTELREAVVWADDASPFTGAQVMDLLTENERLRQRVDVLEAALLGTSTTKSQWGQPCWCRTMSRWLYCVWQPQCKAVQAALATKRGA